MGNVVNWRRGSDLPDRNNHYNNRHDTMWVVFISEMKIYDGEYNFETKKFYVNKIAGLFKQKFESSDVSAWCDWAEFHVKISACIGEKND